MNESFSLKLVIVVTISVALGLHKGQTQSIIALCDIGSCSGGQCPVDGNGCLIACPLGYVAISNSMCMAICDPNCMNGCNVTGVGKCDGVCKSGFVFMTTNKTCAACDPNCMNGCNTNGGGKCDRVCKSGYVFITANKTCAACDANCATNAGCSITGGGRCDGPCKFGYVYTSTNTCLVGVTPRNVSISNTQCVVGTTLLCSAVGFPSPTFEWQDLLSGWFKSGASLTIDSNMAGRTYTFQCASSNTISGITYTNTSTISCVVNSESPTTTTTTDVSLQDRNNSLMIAVIALAIVAGVLLMAYILTVLLLVCCCKKGLQQSTHTVKNDKLDKGNDNYKDLQQSRDRDWSSKGTTKSTLYDDIS